MNQTKTIGIIGGISPMSTAVYYSRMAMEFNALMGGLNYPRMVLSSVNMADIHNAQEKRNFCEPLRIFINAIVDMPSADFILIASNTMHRVVRSLNNIIDRDILDIRDVVAKAVLKEGFHKVLLLGSQYTMEGRFYREYLAEKGLEVVVRFDTATGAYELFVIGESGPVSVGYGNSSYNTSGGAAYISGIYTHAWGETEYSMSGIEFIDGMDSYYEGKPVTLDVKYTEGEAVMASRFPQGRTCSARCAIFRSTSSRVAIRHAQVASGSRR